MDRLEILLDRARLDLPPADDAQVCGSYVSVLGQLAQFSRDPTFKLETTCQCAQLFDDVRETKRRFMSWGKDSGVCVSGDTILNLLSGILRQAGRIEVSRSVDGALFLEDSCEIPRALPLVSDDERQDLVSLAVISTVDPSNPDFSGEQRGLRHFITRLLPGIAVKGEINGSAVVFRGNQEQSHRFRVTCLFTGDPDTLLDVLDSTAVWLSSSHTEDNLILAVRLTTFQIARANNLRPRYSEWHLGRDFLKLAEHGGYLNEETRARNLLEEMSYAILGVTRMGNARSMGKNKKGGGNRVRGKDKGKHCNIGKGERLNYWDCEDGSLEFGGPCVDHGKQVLAE